MKFPTYTKLFFWLLLFVALTTFTACGDDSSSTGTVQVALTDNVDPNLKEVVISIKEVRVVPNGQEATGEEGLPLIKSFDPSLVVNVLDLAYQQEILGEAIVPAGTYNQVRLVLDANLEGLFPSHGIGDVLGTLGVHAGDIDGGRGSAHMASMWTAAL